jgi:large subunit ribosomal protein L19
MNLVEEFEQNTIKALSENKEFPDFKAGDTVRVHVKIKEGSTERIQAYEGVCIARSNKSIGANFTVRKISHGTGVERQFSLYSPLIAKIDVVKRGIVRRAKLYYMRDLSGKAARIKEKLEFEPRDKSAPKAAKA